MENILNKYEETFLLEGNWCVNVKYVNLGENVSKKYILQWNIEV